MDLKVFMAAKRGNIDALHEHRRNLHQMLTPTKNTVLHIYIACAKFSRHHQVQKATDMVWKMLEWCPPLLLQPNGSGDTPLHIAARYGRAGIVQVLIQAAKAGHGDLEKGLDEWRGLEEWRKLIKTPNEEGDTALHQAVRFNHLNVVEILTTQYDPEFLYADNFAGETPLYLAAETGNCKLVVQILKTSTNPDCQGPNGRTALHAAVICKNEDMTKELLEKRKELTKAVDEQGCTPLHLAATLGHTSIVKLLLEHDRSAAYVRDQKDQQTALHLAASKGHVDVMRVLIYKCPDCCELVDKRRRNALHCAIEAGELLVEDFVLEDPWLSNVLLNVKDDNGDTPLHLVAASTSTHLVSSLGIDYRVDKKAFNKKNQNAFDILQSFDRSYQPSSLQEIFKDDLKMKGVKPGCRIVSNKDVENETSKKGELLGDNDKYSRMKSMNDSHLVVATLIATVSFAAGLTMPGGYNQSETEEGFAVLIKNAAFKVFVITNTVAMTLSSCSVLLHLYSSAYSKTKVMTETSFMVYLFTMLALIDMVIAFITGSYAVLGNSQVLPVWVCVIGCLLFFGLAEFMIYSDRAILEGPVFVPLGISGLLTAWLLFKVSLTLLKLFYRALRFVSTGSEESKLARIPLLSRWERKRVKQLTVLLKGREIHARLYTNYT